MKAISEWSVFSVVKASAIFSIRSFSSRDPNQILTFC
jgi:hypothetical protein